MHFAVVLLRIEILHTFLFWGTSEADGGETARDSLRSSKLLCEERPTSESSRRKIAEHFSWPETKNSSELFQQCVVVGPGCYERRRDGTVFLPPNKTVFPPSDYLITEDNLYVCPRKKRTRYWREDTPLSERPVEGWRYALFIIVSVVVVGGALVLIYLGIFSPISLISRRYLEPYVSPCLQPRSIF